MDSVLNCMVTDHLDNGEYYDRFLKTAKEKLRFEFGLALRSPALALSLALDCLDLPEGSIVALSALSDPWVPRLLEQRKLLPFWLDVDAGSACISAAALETLSGSGARALYLAHPWGVMIDPLLLQDVGIPIIEDISTALGGSVDGRPLDAELAASAPVPAATGSGAGGSSAEADDETLPDDSLNYSKAGSLGMFVILGLEHANAITGGSGALLYTNNRRDAQVLRNLAEKVSAVELLADMNAALALSQLKDAERFLEKRGELFKLYEQSLIRAHKKSLMSTREARPAYYGCVVVLDSGIKDVRAYAKKKEVDTMLAFERSCVALGLVPEGSCPVAASLANRALAFPLHPRLGKTAAQKVAKVLATLP